VKRRVIVICACLAALAMAPAMFADVTDYLLNLNGTSYCPSFTVVTGCSNTGGLGAVPGLSSTLDTSNGGTGLGTLTLTYNPGPGSYLVDFWLFEQLSQPGFNEYGAWGGSAASGQSWQIDVPDYDYTASFDPNFGSLPAGAGSIIANSMAGALSNTNYVTGNNSQYLLGCSGDATCNDYVSMAMGFNFSLGANQEEVVTLNVSNTAPASGFYLEQIHPVDGNNSAAIQYYLTGSATTQPIGKGVPEPGTGLLVAAFAVFLVSPYGRRLRNRNS